jgi:ankyrin repeat protein
MIVSVSPIKDSQLMGQLELIRKNDWRATKLRIDQIPLGDAGAEVVAAALKGNSKVIKIELMNSKIGPRGFTSLAEAVRGNQKIKELYISDNEISAEAAQALITALKTIPTLTELHITRCKIASGSEEALASLVGSHPALTTFVSSKSFSDSKGSLAIAGGLKQNTRLQTLKLSDNAATDESGKALFSSLGFRHKISLLDFSINEMGIDSSKALSVFLTLTETLTSLDISTNQFKNEGATALSVGLKKNKTLRTLVLRGNQICAAGAESLADAVAGNISLTTLDLGDNSLGDDGAEAFARCLPANKIKTLVLYNNGFGARGSNAIALALRCHPVLTSLNLGCNSLGDDGANRMGEGLAVNTRLLELSLAKNNISDAGGEALARSLATNGSLHDFDLTHNTITEKAAQQFLITFKKNPSCAIFSSGLLQANKIADTQLLKAIDEQLVANAELNRALLEAARSGSLRNVETCLDKGADINFSSLRDWSGLAHTPLQGAASRNQLDIVRFLVEKGANVSKKSHEELTALDYAKAAKHDRIVAYLSGLILQPSLPPPQVLSIPSTKKTTIEPIVDAAGKGDIARLNGYAAQGLDIDVVDKDGITPLMKAVLEGQLPTVQWFKQQKNVNFDKRDPEGRTLFLLAASKGKLNVGQWLVSDQATRLNDKDFNFNTPFMLASGGGHLAFVQWLVEKNYGMHKASSQTVVFSYNKQGQDATILATIGGHLHVLKYFKTKFNLASRGDWFKEKQDSKKTADKEGNSLLHLAALHGHDDMVTWMVSEKIASPNDLNNGQQKAVDLAKMKGHEKIAAYLNSLEKP